MKRVRFIEPQGRRVTAYKPYIREWPLIGPLILATLLRDRGHDVTVYNENISGPVTDSPAVMHDICEADFVGISIMTPTATRGYEISRAVRTRSGRPRLMMGGVHATFRPLEALQYADYVVTGEGENAIAEIVEGRAEPGIVPGTPVENLDALPVPDYDLTYEFGRAWERRGSKQRYHLPLATSRGCPHSCRY